MLEHAIQSKSTNRGNTKSLWQTGFPKLDAAIKLIFGLGLPAGLLIWLVIEVVIPMVGDARENTKSVPLKVESVKAAVVDEGEKTRTVITENGRETHDLLREHNNQMSEFIKLFKKNTGQWEEDREHKELSDK